MADSKFVVDADTGPINSKLDRTKGKFREVAQAAGPMDHALGRWNSGMSSFLVKTLAVLTAIRASAQAASSLIDKKSANSENYGKRQVGITESLVSLGIRDVPKQAGSFLDQSGMASQEQRLAFASALASARSGSEAPWSPATSVAALDAFAKGGQMAFGPGGSEIIKGLGDGRSMAKIIKGSMASRPALTGIGPDGKPFSHGLMDTDAMREIAVRGDEDMAQSFIEGRDFRSGLETRRSRASATNRLANMGDNKRFFAEMTPDLLMNPVKSNVDSRETLARSMDRLTGVMDRLLRKPNVGTEEAP